MPRRLGVFALLLFLVTLSPGRDAWAQAGENPLNIQARSAYLVEARTGRVLYDFNSGERMQPASLAKIMTFDLALEDLAQNRIRMEDTTTVSRKAWQLALDQNVSRMFLEVGDVVTVEQLLYGLMVASGNDAAIALAEFLAGSEEAFVIRMNEQAQKLGLTDTRFVNSHGLEAEDQYTTARDMARLALHVVRTHPEALAITQTEEFQYKIPTPQRNYNRLLFKDDRVTGLKTGHLGPGTYHLVATAEEGTMSLVGVVMGAANEEARTEEAEKLLQYGFSQFRTLQVPWQNQVETERRVYKGRADTVPLTVRDAPFVTLKRGEEDGLTVTAEVQEPLVAPIQEGQELGSLVVRSGEEVLGRFPLVAAQAVERGGFFKVLFDSLRLFFASLVSGGR